MDEDKEVWVVIAASQLHDYYPPRILGVYSKYSTADWRLSEVFLNEVISINVGPEGTKYFDKENKLLGYFFPVKLNSLVDIEIKDR